MERVSWIKNGSNYRRVTGSVSNVDTVPKGVYNIGFSMTGWYLEQTGERFTFDYKVYGLQTEFVNHIMEAFHNTKGNLGILLNGTKGTGKTVTAKMLANKFELPIILVKSFGDKNDALIEYLASFNFDCVFFFDEFEKNFDKADSSILQIMDGVYTSEYRRIFLLTTNETEINDNLISRPSRLRYVKEFGNLEESVVSEYLDDTLKDLSCKQSVMDFVDTLQISTIDILKSIVDEVNIFGVDKFLNVSKQFFNVKTAKFTYKLYYHSIEIEKLSTYPASLFLEDVMKFMFHPKPNVYTFDDSESYNQALSEWEEGDYKPTHRIHSGTINNSEKSFKNLKVGDLFGYHDYDERVITKDFEKSFIATKNDNFVTYYYIVNPNYRPTLYKDSSIEIKL